MSFCCWRLPCFHYWQPFHWPRPCAHSLPRGLTPSKEGPCHSKYLKMDDTHKIQEKRGRLTSKQFLGTDRVCRACRFHIQTPWIPPLPPLSSRSVTSLSSSSWNWDGEEDVSDEICRPEHPPPLPRLAFSALTGPLLRTEEGRWPLWPQLWGSEAVKMALLSRCLWWGCSSSTEPVTSPPGGGSGIDAVRRRQAGEEAVGWIDKD